MNLSVGPSDVNGLNTEDAPYEGRPRLGKALVVLDEPFFRHEGRLYSPSHWWRFADVLATQFEQLDLYAMLADAPPPPHASRVALRRAGLHGRFFYETIERFYRRLPFERAGLLRDAARLFAQYDVIMFRVPAAVAPMLGKVAWRLRKPTVVLVAGDVVLSNRYAEASGLKAFVARRVASRARRAEKRLAAKAALAAVWGNELVPVFAAVNSRTAVAASPNVRESHIVYRPDTCTDRPVRVARVCQVVRTKGIECLVEALAAVRKRGHDVRVDVAGSLADGVYHRELAAQVDRLGLGEYVTFHGPLELGGPLFDFYRSADIHVVSSLGEGLPRCIVEGRCFGLPTVGTRVGGIPTVIHDEEDGLLVAPRDSAQIADAVERLIADGALRRHIIAAGYALARTQTAEFQARRLARLMAGALRGEDLPQWALDLNSLGDG